MRAFHDSRDRRCRTPYGVVAPGDSVSLWLDVWDAPGARVTLRTWMDGVGERRHDMPLVSGPDENGAWRYEARLALSAPGIVWYHFIITLPDGREVRYGARDGRYGGRGQLRDWEPPSFPIAVCDPAADDELLASILAEEDVVRRPPMKVALRYLRGEASAHELREAVEVLRQTVSPRVFNRSFNVLASCTQPHLFALLSGAREDVTDYARELDLLKDPAKAGLSKARLWCAALIQMLSVASLDFPHGEERLDAGLVADASGEAGAPGELGVDATGKLGAFAEAVAGAYVTGEASASGEADAGASAEAGADSLAAADACASVGSYAYGHICPPAFDKDCEDIVRNASELHDILPAFRAGELHCFAVNADVFGFWRCANNGTTACVLVNASLRNAYDVAVPLVAEEVSDLLGGYGVRVVSLADAGDVAVSYPETSRYAMVHLYQTGTAVLLFHPHERLQRPMPAGLGVLAHITSLPVEAACDQVASASAGCDQAADAVAEGCDQAAGATLEDRDQLAPTPTHPGTLGAPARAFIDWLAEAGVTYWQVLPVNPTDEYGSPYAGISAFAGNVNLLEGGAAALDAPDLPDEASAEYQAFCEQEHDWLEPYVCFMAIREAQGDSIPWQEWPREYQRFDAKLLANEPALAASAKKWRRLQFAFQWQWEKLRTYAHEKGVRIIGDMPLYVSADSADVWAHRELFQLDAAGRPSHVAGCPPDSFAVDGQIWGNPLYDWDVAKRTGYDWWIRRVKRALSLYDFVRMDHFIGFARYFSIPAGETASAGEYHPGPGLDFFQTLHQACGPLPFIAEDLGSITPSVRALGAACGFPGMDVIQFVDGGNPLAGYTPRPHKVVYSGTHDNQTLRGFACMRYPQLESDQAAAALANITARAQGDLCVFALQDVLGLDDQARMNTPGTTRENWTWQASAAELEQGTARLKELVALHRDEA